MYYIFIWKPSKHYENATTEIKIRIYTFLDIRIDL